MPGIRLPQWRFSSRVLVPIVLVIAATTLLLTGLLVYAARESDQIARERQAKLVSHVLTEQIGKIAHDQQSVTIWDDSLEHLQGPPDFDWFDLNLGVWLHDYFGHDDVFVLNGRDEPVYAMAGGARADPISFAVARDPLLPLIERLRSTIRADPTVIENDAASLNVTDLVVLAGRPAAASVVPIVSDSGEIEQAAGTEPLHISVRFLDGSFLDAVMQQYLIEGARFSWDDNAAAGEATIPLADNAGKPIGYFVWQPDRPGWRLLTRMAPFLLGALLIVALIIALLVLRLKRAMTELLASEAQAQHLAFHDPLTGLANRALFSDRLDRALIESRKTGQRLALLYLDLDRFKNVNDTLGHPAGDDLIRELAQRLSALVRSTDCVSRLGGDEFAIIQAKVVGHEDVAALCERIIQTVASPFDILDSTAFVGISIGVAIAPEAGVDRAELVRKADIALYRAKLEGRNRFRIFQDEMDATIQRRRAIEAELRDALAAGDQFQLVYQPLFANDAKHLVGVEALLRWNHPVHGLLSPATFVPIAEESGLIQEIGEWVLWEACRKAVGWPIRRIAVNVSPVQFRTARFAARVLEILAETGLEPSKLELEITESVLLDSAEMSMQTFNTLRAAGVRIALDDFGTGYSSLNYLHKYAVDKIKIDRSFVQNLDSDAASDAIVQAMVDLARAMRVEVTAEGVETVAQRDFLQSIGCNELQGFLLSRPLKAEQVDGLLGTPGQAPLQAVASAA